MSKNNNSKVQKASAAEKIDSEKRDFMVLAATAMAGVGAAATAVPFIHSLNPAKDVKALASIEVDISGLEPGDEMKVKWRGKPVFIKRRSESELAEARAVDIAELKDPQTDAERVIKGKEEFLVVLGVCTHLGCVPLGKGSGEFNAWFCPCHGSHYDISGRIRKGPAPKNLIVPEYNFVTDKVIKIG
ncbi:MAG: ubiquinol-cytochrome c reductase iron-sulfur subunit [Rickettsiales bacterium]